MAIKNFMREVRKTNGDESYMAIENCMREVRQTNGDESSNTMENFTREVQKTSAVMHQCEHPEPADSRDHIHVVAQRSSRLGICR